MTIFIHVLLDMYKNVDSLNMSRSTCMENPFSYARDLARACCHDCLAFP